MKWVVSKKQALAKQGYYSSCCM